MEIIEEISAEVMINAEVTVTEIPVSITVIRIKETDIIIIRIAVEDVAVAIISEEISQLDTSKVRKTPRTSLNSANSGTRQLWSITETRMQSIQDRSELLGLLSFRNFNLK